MKGCLAMPGSSSIPIKVIFEANKKLTKCSHSKGGVYTVEVLPISLGITSASQLGVCNKCGFSVIWDEGNSIWYPCKVQTYWEDK